MNFNSPKYRLHSAYFSRWAMTSNRQIFSHISKNIYKKYKKHFCNSATLWSYGFARNDLVQTIRLPWLVCVVQQIFRCYRMLVVSLIFCFTTTTHLFIFCSHIQQQRCGSSFFIRQTPPAACGGWRFYLAYLYWHNVATTHNYRYYYYHLPNTMIIIVIIVVVVMSVTSCHTISIFIECLCM